jgi:hypothetical protein
VDFNWSEADISFKQKMQEFAASQLNVENLQRDQSGEFSVALWQACADFGIQSLSVPSVYNSSGQDTPFLSAMLAMEAIGYGCRDNGLAFALNAQMWTVQLPIVQAGTEDQQQRFLPAMTAGTMIGCHAMTESESGSDSYSLQTIARKCDGGYRVTGRKCMISLGPICDMALVFATTAPELGKWGISAFLIEHGNDGFERGPVQSKMGLRTVPIGELNFHDCYVPACNRLGPEGAGVSLSTSFLEWERCCILASQLGAMERQLDECIAYAKKRKQFGKSIGKYQSVANRVADMRLRIETCRLLLYKVAWLKSEGKSATLEAAMLKLHLSESFAESSMDAIRIHGGRGFLTEYEIERDLRDAVGGLLYAGTSDIQRNIIAAVLGL